MALSKESLLKFSKTNELAVKLIEDDSSGGDNGTEVKILHLANNITAEGSIPTPDGTVMKVTGNKVYVAADNIDEMLKDMDEKDGVLIYRGPMHLDVSKPKGRNVAGQFTVTSPAKIWLVKTKFSRSGGNLATQQRQSLSDVVNNMFKGGKAFDLTAETTAVPSGTTGTPTVVENKDNAEKNGKGKKTEETAKVGG